MSKGHYIFGNQPSFTIFNKSFDDPSDVLFQQLNEIDPFFLSKEQLEDKSCTLTDEVIDPRTNKEPQCSTYIYNEPNKNCSIFKGDGIKSTLTKAQQSACLRVLFGWQERTEINENDLLVWRQQKNKIEKEREHMQQYINAYSEKNKETMYASTRRLNEYYRQWFKRKVNVLQNLYKENLAFNTRNGLPHVSVCKGITEERAEISDVKLLERNGWIRILSSDKNIEWMNLNFRLDTYKERFINSIERLIRNELEDKVIAALNDFDEHKIKRNCYLPFETILFLLTAGDYVDLATECLLEIANVSTDDHKSVKFDEPFPARNCGWHTQQQMMQQAFTTFSSAKGRSRWLEVKNDAIKIEEVKTEEIHAVNERGGMFKALTYERFFENNTNSISKKEEEELVRNNSALIEWSLKSPESTDGLKILTRLSLPPCLDEQAKSFIAFETIKLEYKAQFGCEMLSKYELLCAWLKMRLITNSTPYGICYRISSIDCDIELKETLTLEVVENHLKQYYHINPSQLIANLAEFLKLLLNMPTGKYMLRYSSKYKDKLLLCEPTNDITQNTVYLYSLLQTEPTDMAFMTQFHYLPIVDNLCSRVHLKYRILPLAFLPVLPHQKNQKGLQTPATRAKAYKLALQKKQSALLKIQKSKTEAKEAKQKKNKRWRQRQKKSAAKKKQIEEEAESKRLLQL